MVRAINNNIGFNPDTLFEFNDTGDFADKINTALKLIELNDKDSEMVRAINNNIGFNPDTLFDLTPFNDTRHFADKINAKLNEGNASKQSATTNVNDDGIITSINGLTFNLSGLFDLTLFNNQINTLFNNQINTLFNSQINTQNNATATATAVNDLTTNEVNQGIANINVMLEQYFKMSSILFKTVEPDPAFAYMLDNVPRYTPIMKVGSEPNKIVEQYEKFKEFMGDNNLPPLPNVMPSYVGYDALNIVFTESKDGEIVGDKIILDKGLTTQ